jgi:hypothetical protein
LLFSVPIASICWNRMIAPPPLLCTTNSTVLRVFQLFPRPLPVGYQILQRCSRTMGWLALQRNAF